MKDNPLKMSVPKNYADVLSLLSLQLFYTKACSHAFSASWMGEGHQLKERNGGQQAVTIIVIITKPYEKREL